MKDDIPKRRTAVKPEVATREKREPPPLKMVATIPRDELGTIPKGYSYADAIAVIEKVGCDTWRAWGYSKRLDALSQARRN